MEIIKKTFYDGNYEFKYLRNSLFKIYNYSWDMRGQDNFTFEIYAPLSPIIKNAAIAKRKKVADLPDINVNIK